MGYEVEFMPQAVKSLEKLDEVIICRMLVRLKRLAENFENVPPEPLHGSMKGFYKLRVGDYRAIYTVNEQRIIVHLAGHRREIYKK